MKKLLLSILLLTAFAMICTAATHNVAVTNNAFSPNNLTVRVGDKVTWLVAEGKHTTTSGSQCTANGIWGSGEMTEGMKYEYTFGAEGTFPYFCIPHCTEGMTGTVTVLAANGMIDQNTSANITSLKNYPNPFINATTFSFNANNSGKAQVQIISVDGKIISNETVYVRAGQNILPVELDAPAGIYIVKIQLEGILTETRIIARKE